MGTSGWSYPHWRGSYYPIALKSREWLDSYTRDFRTVELNRSFYRLPTPEAIAAWRAQVPAGFTFAVKASRFITHMKKLKDPEASIALFFERVAGLGPAIGPILFQLPPRWRFDAERLASFLSALPACYRYAFEFRDPSWYDPRAFELLRAHRAAFCLYDLAGHQSPLEVTTDLVYVRLHGPGRAYQGSYDDATLALWARRCRAWAAEGREVYCYFDNDQAGHAPHDALRLRALVEAPRGQESGMPAERA